MGGLGLAVVIPAHCEAQTIAPVVAAAKQYGTVFVIDDCSTDNTGQVAAEAGAVLLRNETQKGYDGSLNRGFDEAFARGFDYIVTMDADGEHDPELLSTFRRLLINERVPLVLGIRPRTQRLAELIMGRYMHVRFGIADILCGMKGYHRDLVAANGGFDHVGSIGTELAFNSVRRGAKFVQVSVTGTPRAGTPRFGTSVRANARIFSALCRVLSRAPEAKQR